MTVQVTREDILRAGRSGGDNPISRALLRETSQAWVVFGGGVAYSRSAPHHALALPYEVSQKWRLWSWEPFEFEIHWMHSDPQPHRDKRQRQRRTHPRFGHDRRARDRRNRNRRHGDRRGPFFSGSDRRDLHERGAGNQTELVAEEISVETPAVETPAGPPTGDAR